MPTKIKPATDKQTSTQPPKAKAPSPPSKAAATKKAPADQAAAPASSKLAVGQKAPAFKLSDADGKTVRLADYAGQRVVLFFYPKADTPGCTRESCDFRDQLADFKRLGSQVIGISKDAPAALKKFEQKYQLPFPLLSDPDHAVQALYGAWGTKNMYGKLVEGTIRSTFLIGPDGKIQRIWPKVRVEGHADQVLQALTAA